MSVEKGEPFPNTAEMTDANIMSGAADQPNLVDEEKEELEAQPVKPNPMDPASFPDGGSKAWLAVSGGFCCLFCSFGWINAIGIFQTEYEKRELSSYSASDIAWIPSLETFFMFAGGPICGKLYDNHGPRWILLIGSFLHVFGLMMASLSSKYYQFLLSQGVCSPIGASMVFYPAMSSTTTWFFKRRAFAFGVVAAGSSLGGVIFPIMVNRLISEKGFPWAMRAAAFLILGLLVYANLTVRSRLPPSPKPWSLIEFARPFKELTFSLTMLGAFLFCFGLFIPFSFIILSAEYNGMSARLAVYLLAVLNAVSIFGRTLPGIFADRFGRFNTMILTSGLSTVLILGLWIPARGNAAFIVLAALYGFSSGAYVSVIPALVAQISDVRQIGLRTGSLFAVVSIAALVGSPIGGALVTEDKGSYLHLQIFTGVMMFAGTAAFVAARASQKGLSIMRKV